MSKRTELFPFLQRSYSIFNGTRYMEENELINRVANSGLLTFNLEDLYPEGEVVSFDIKDYLYMGLILKEKDFREALKEHDWTRYEGKVLAVFCSEDAIIPVWAYMLVAAHASAYAVDIFQGNPENYYKMAFNRALAKLDIQSYVGKRIVIKGCSDKPVPPSAYLELTRLLQPVAQSIMYGEPCSTVPVFKRPRSLQE